MKAIVNTIYGPPEVLQLKEVESRFRLIMKYSKNIETKGHLLFHRAWIFVSEYFLGPAHTFAGWEKSVAPSS